MPADTKQFQCRHSQLCHVSTAVLRRQREQQSGPGVTKAGLMEEVRLRTEWRQEWCGDSAPQEKARVMSRQGRTSCSKDVRPGKRQKRVTGEGGGWNTKLSAHGKAITASPQTLSKLASKCMCSFNSVYCFSGRSSSNFQLQYIGKE